MQILSEQELLRREKRTELKAMGINPYPSQSFKATHFSDEILEGFEKDEASYQEVTISGRLMSRRIQGKAGFAEIQDKNGRIQIYVARDEVCEGEDKALYNDVWKKKLDIGDIIGVKGFVFKTQVGQTTLHVKEIELLTKSLKPLPIAKTDADGVVHDAFTDPELRYRQRYVDLVVNPQVKDAFVKRSKMVQTMKQYLVSKDFLEVETPILQPIYGGASARPFKTHHNTLDMPLYMRIANELYLKRLIVGGFDRVFEFAKDFRNEGMSRFHNPEFTQVELYAAYRDYNWMMDLVEEMVEKVAIALHGSTTVTVGENEINFQRPWKRYTMFEAIQEYTGIDISKMNEDELRATAKQLNVPIDETMGYGKLIDEIFGENCEGKLIQPTFITDYPVEMSPLAKRHADNPNFVERFEAICNGKEICNAFSELNDPIDQRERFEDQLKLKEKGDDEAMVLDEDFLRALEYGMPPTAGLGIGIDRLAMVMTNSNSIQDVLFFPQMKAEKKEVLMSETDYSEIGIDTAWTPVFHKAGIYTKDHLKGVNPSKLFNEVCGLRKKLKLDLKNPSKEEVEAWVAAVQG